MVRVPRAAFSRSISLPSASTMVNSEAKRLQLQKEALNGCRDDYLLELQRRKSRILRKLQKEAGLKL